MLNIKYYISALYLSLFSRKFYADLIGNRTMFGIKYIMLISLIIAMPLAFEVKAMINSIFSSDSVQAEDNIDYISAQFPDINAVNGKLKIALQTNQSIISKSGQLAIILDAENKIDDLTGYEKVIIINDHSLRLKLPDDRGVILIPSNELIESLRQYFISDSGKLDKQRFFDDIKRISRTTFVFVILLSFFWFFFNYVMAALAYSFVAGAFLIFISKQRVFNFRQSLRIASFTLTPVALLEAISTFSGGGIFYHTSLVFFITHVLYIHFAIESYKKYRDVNPNLVIL